MNNIFLSFDLPMVSDKDFSGLAYSGGIFRQDRIIDLSSLSFKPEITLFYQHYHSNPIGVVSEIQNTGLKLNIKGKLFSEIDRIASDIVEKAAKGVKYQLSIGVFDIDYVSAKEGEVINGVELHKGMTILKHGNLREVSISPLAVDEETNLGLYLSQGNIEQELASIKESLITAEARIQELELEKRTSEISAFFANIGKVEDLTPYLRLSYEDWEKIKRDFNTLIPRGKNRNLFSEEAIDTLQGVKPGFSVDEVYKSRRAMNG